MNGSDNIQGSMSEAQLFELLHDLINSCNACCVAHRECRVKRNCYDCDTAFWIRELKRHFGIVA